MSYKSKCNERIPSTKTISRIIQKDFIQYQIISFSCFMSFFMLLKIKRLSLFINSVACNRRVSQSDTQEGVNICTYKHRHWNFHRIIRDTHVHYTYMCTCYCRNIENFFACSFNLESQIWLVVQSTCCYFMYSITKYN